jgi:uncharacterized protein involved in outer membrane biogenesis
LIIGKLFVRRLIMKKALKWIGIGICALVVLLLAGVTFFGGATTRVAVNTFGPTLLGVPISLEGASFRPLAGKLTLTKLHIGNPKDFKTPALFDVDKVEIEIKPKSLLSKVIHIRKIIIAAPHITYETSRHGSNIGTLTKQLESGKKKPEEKTKGTKFVIDELIITDAEVDVSMSAAGGHAIPIKIGKIELKDIGKEHGGVTLSDAIAIAVTTVAGNIETAALNADGLIDSGANAIGTGAKAVGDTVVDSASSVVKELGALLGADKNADAKK